MIERALHFGEVKSPFAETWVWEIVDMLMNLLLVIEVIVAVFLIVVVLLQRSEGGGLVSGGTSSLVSVRGAGDLLTRTTWILGGIFFVLALALAIVAGRGQSSASVVDRLKVNAVNPADLTKAPPTPPAGTALPGSTDGGPAPLQAPTPTINSPFGSLPATPAPALSAPAPAPTAPAKK